MELLARQALPVALHAPVPLPVLVLVPATLAALVPDRVLWEVVPWVESASCVVGTLWGVVVALSTWELAAQTQAWELAAQTQAWELAETQAWELAE